MADRPDYYIGLMSGTSIDGVDAGLIAFEGDSPRFIAGREHPIPAELKQQLIGLCTPGANEIERMGEADRAVGLLFAEAVQALLKANNLTAADIVAIGSHGQTIRHRPSSPERPPHRAFTLQIGDPNTIAQGTGITTVADLRRRDVAAGGQGAPLASAFHHHVFASNTAARAVINIGGIANITFIAPEQPVLGFDCGPGNGLMDAWIDRHKQRAYDTDGQWARGGEVDNTLLEQWLKEDYFYLPLPKTTGRELFNIDWLDKHLSTTAATPSPQDVQRSLLALTVSGICRGLAQLPQPVDEIYICGGGALNAFLMECLAAALPDTRLASTAALGIAPEWVEAMTFAWLARRCLQGLPGNMPSVTHASEPVILGGIYPGCG